MKKLVGEGKPFHSAVDKTAALLKRKVGTGAEFMKELMGVSGVKPTELQERGLTEIMGMPRMTHDQFMANLSIRPAPAIHEKVLGEKPALPSKEVLRRNANDLIRVRAREYASEGTDTSAEYRRLAAEEMQRLRSNHMDQALRLAEIRATENPSSTYHKGYTLPGGDNYREMLIKAPKGVDNQEKIMELEAKLRRARVTNNEEQDQWNSLYNQIRDLRAQEAASPQPFQGVGSHFGGEPGILASMRLKDRTGPNGEKLLHLEELQSDWHQNGRDKGYKDPQAEQKFKQVDDLRRTFFELNKRRRELHEQALQEPDYSPKFQSMMDEANGITPKLLELNSQIHDLEHLKKQQQDAVPDAPFKKNWEEVALKRLIHHAAEKGYHGVVVTPGAEQAKRYSIGNHLHTLEHYPETGELRGYDKEGNRVVDEKNVFDKNIADYIGKEGAEKLRQAPAEKNGQLRVLEGADLHYGGKGMKAFYDTKVPNILNSIGKKYGVKTQLGGHRLKGSPEDYGNAVEKLGIAHIPMAQLTPEQNQKIAETADKRLHHFPITEEMRKDVLTNGLPLYNKGGTVHMADGGDMDTMQLEMTNKKTKKPTVEQMKQAIFAKAQQGLMKPSEVLGKHEGKYLHMTEADRAKVEKRKHGMRGGVGFTQIGLEDPEYAGRTWGVGKASVAAKLLRRQRKGLTPEEQSIWTTFIGTPEMHTSNQLVFNRMWNKFQEAKKAGLLDPEQEAKMLEIMRSAMTKGSAKKPPKAIFESDANFDNTHHLFDTFERRRILADLMSGKRVGGKKGQIFDASKMIEDTTDPRLLHAPTLSVGPHVFSFDDKISYEPHLNKAFPYMLHGETSPDAFTQLPFTVAAPDFAQQIRQSKGREPGYMDIVRGIPRQQLTEKYLTALQKQGYNRGGPVRMAAGGQVDVQSIGVNEAPNMDVKQFFAPRPATSGVLPVGGIQQAQQAPMQPQQPQPGMPGQPQQPGQPPMQPNQPQPGQQLQQQQPSNILQMTRQGQAMNAMTPPKQMARGGQVDRDTMMLALMNRQMARR